jgi:hypothetical protein
LPDAADDLKATAADLAADAERLAQVEREKVSLAPTDPRLKDLASEAESIAQELPIKAAAQTELIKELADS